MRFDERGWPTAVAVETEPCDPQPVMCDYINHDGLACLNEAEEGETRCSWHPEIGSDAQRAILNGTGDDRRWPTPTPQ